MRSGFVALLGLPNAGKSTLLNRLLGGKLSIVTAKPQTTRHRILGVVERKGVQAVFIDTPGWLDPKYALQKSMRSQARRALREDADVLCLLVEPGSLPSGLEPLFELLSKSELPLLAAVNKTDAASEGLVASAEAALRERLPRADLHRISAKTGAGVKPLLAAAAKALPEQPAFFPAGQLTDRNERFYVAEVIREAIFELYEKELPYSSAVEIESYREREGQEDEASAVIVVEREGQKGILIGKGGKALRRLTLKAEAAAKDLIGRPIRLELWIKVRKGWRRDSKRVKELGY